MQPKHNSTNSTFSRQKGAMNKALQLVKGAVILQGEEL
jgi:hypothetical protein